MIYVINQIRLIIR